MVTDKEKVIFFGNGSLAEYALAVLGKECQVIFHAHRAEDLAEVVRLKKEYPEAHGVLASFGVIIREDVLKEFESEGILNIHPSLLPKYRGPSPIETAILNGDEEFGVSVMKLVPEMDAGPIYVQATLSGLPLDKDTIYRELATTGARMVLMVIEADKLRSKKFDDPEEEANRVGWLKKVDNPELQDNSKATYTEKMTKAMGALHPETETADEILRKIVAYAGYPKAKYALFGQNCTILAAHKLKSNAQAVLPLKCADGQILAIDSLQPEGRKVMDAKSFVNGYRK